MNDIQTYTEQWQYTPWVATHKDPQGPTITYPDRKDPSKTRQYVQEDSNDLSVITLWRYASYKPQYAVGIKHFTFDELVDAARDGHTIARLNSDNGTRFLIIDIDNDQNENVTEAELDSLTSPTFRWTYGASGRPYRYHIYVLLNHAIKTSAEAETETARISLLIRDSIGRPVAVDSHQFSLSQVCFGCRQHCMERKDLQGTYFWSLKVSEKTKWHTKPVDPNSVGYLQPSRPHLMPYNTSMLANMVFDGKLSAAKDSSGNYIQPMCFLEGKRFDCATPALANRYIPEKKRFNHARSFIKMLVPMFYRCQQYNLYYTEDDLIYTFRYLCIHNFEYGQQWYEKTGKSMESGLLKEYRKNQDLSYKDIEARYKSSHKSELYRRKGYVYYTTQYICTNLSEQFDQNEATFNSFEDLRTILVEKHVSYSAFMGVCKYLDITINYSYRRPKGKDYSAILEHAKDSGIYYYFPSSYSEGERSFCRRNGILYKNFIRSCLGLTQCQFKKRILNALSLLKQTSQYHPS